MCGMSLADTAEVFLAPTRVPLRHDVPPTLTSIDKETVEKSLHRELIFRPVSPDDTVVRGWVLGLKLERSLAGLTVVLAFRSRVSNPHHEFGIPRRLNRR